MRFVRQLAAVLLVVAVVVAAGVVAERASPPAAQRELGPPVVLRATPGAPLTGRLPGERIEIDHGPLPAADPGPDLRRLVRTGAIETIVMTVVVAIGVGRQRRRRARRDRAVTPRW
jgi:hypothetical protein